MRIIYIIIFLFQFASGQSTIIMEEINGVYYVPCKVNGVDMSFVFDTGASEVSLSKIKADELVRQGLLTEEDILGKVNFKVADGTVGVGLKVRLREIKIKDLVLTNVTATIIDNDLAPLLLGQSALEHLGKYEIEGNILKLYPRSDKSAYEFLGIDLTRTIEDFNLSRVNLSQVETLLPVDFETCKVSKDHLLKKINFNIQKIVFNKKGEIISILLRRIISNSFSFQNENEAEQIFKEIIKILEIQYGKPSESLERFVKWSSTNYEIALSRNSDDTSVVLVYNPIILINQEHELLKDNRKEIIAQPKQELNSIRKQFASLVESQLNNSIYYIEVKSLNDVLQIKCVGRETNSDKPPSNDIIIKVIKENAFEIFNMLRKNPEFLSTFHMLFDHMEFHTLFKFKSGNYTRRYSINAEIESNLNQYTSREEFIKLLDLKL